MRGRKPLPAETAALHGVDSKRSRLPLPPVLLPPATVPGLSEAPDWLTDGQKAVWDRCVANAPLGVLHAIDQDAMTAFVIAVDTHRRVALQLEVTPFVNGEGQVTRLLAVLNQQSGVVLRAAEQLGFTPVSRPRLTRPAEGFNGKTERRTLPDGQGPATLEEWLAAAPDKATQH